MSTSKTLLTAAVAAGLATAADANTSLKIGYFPDDQIDVLKLDLTNAADEVAQKKKKIKKPKKIKTPKSPKDGIREPRPSTPSTCCGVTFKDDLITDFVSIGSGSDDGNDLLDPTVLIGLEPLETHDDPNWVDGIEYAQTYWGGSPDDAVVGPNKGKKKPNQGITLDNGIKKPGEGITLDNGLKKPGKLKQGKKRKKQ